VAFDWDKASTSQILARRRSLKRKFGNLYDEVLTIVSRHDPVVISGVPDEYVPEVDTILPLLERAQSKSDVRRIVHREFVDWFGARIAGPESRYAEVAGEIWDAWQRYRSGLQPRKSRDSRCRRVS
jgi:hypothetical protein